MANDPDISLRVAARAQNLCVVRAAVETALDRLGLSQDDVMALVLAVDEAMTNTIRHGYCGECDKPIWLTINPLSHDGRRGVEVVIEDEAEHADPSRVRRLQPNPRRPGGLGVHIIHEAVDEVKYDIREGGRGMRLTLRKFLTRKDDPIGETA